MKNGLSLTFSLALILFLSAGIATSQGQGTLSVPLNFNVDFSATSNQPGANQPFGDANFFLNGWDYATASPASNVLDIYFVLGANQATDGWLLQKGSDGALTPIIEISNELYFSNSPFPGTPQNSPFPGGPTQTYPSYAYSESYELNSDQVQNLLAGNWYAEIDFGGGNTYLGNLTAVPEPGSFALLGLGMAAFLRRRRK